MTDRSRTYHVDLDGRPLAVRVEQRSSVITTEIEGVPGTRPVRVLSAGPSPLVLVEGRVVALALGGGDRPDFALRGRHGEARAVPASRAASGSRAALSASGHVQAPMPGRVVSVRVRAGDVVTAGTPLVVVEAMKMQNELLAPRDATVSCVLVADGDAVDRGATLVELS